MNKLAGQTPQPLLARFPLSAFCVPAACSSRDADRFLHMIHRDHRAHVGIRIAEDFNLHPVVILGASADIFADGTYPSPEVRRNR